MDKKILLVSLEYPPQVGGIASYVDQFASALDPENVVVLAPPEEGAEEYDEKKDFKIYRKLFYLPRIFWPRWIMLYFSIRSVLDKEDIDIIYLHHIIPVGYVAWIIKKLHDIPYLIFSHGIDIITATRNDWKKRWVNKVTDEADQIITNSESLNKRLLKRVSEVSEEKTTVLYPCPEDIFKQSPGKKKIAELENKLGVEGKQVMLTVSRLVKGKGIEHLVKLMPEILKERPHLVWVIVGDGPERENMEELIHEYNLQNVVRFVGEKKHEELPTYYYLADLFVLLTHPHHGVEEGLGLVFLEAAAAGLPTIAGESGGVEEAVIDEETGYVVGTFRDEEVKNKITKLLDNPDLAKEMGKKAQERIESEFVWEKQLQKLDKWM